MSLKVYRRSYRDKDGHKKKCRTFSIRYKDPYTGKWKFEPTNATSRAAAEAIAAEFEQRLHGELAAIDCAEISSSTAENRFEEVLAEYLAFQMDRWSPRTLHVRGGILRYVIGKLGVVDPCHLSLAWINRYVAQRKAHKWGEVRPQTINAEMKHLRRFLTWAKIHGFVEENPLHHWTPLLVRQKDRRKKRAMTPEEVSKLLAVAPPFRRIAWIVMLATGTRRDEAVQLLISDFHPDKRYILVRAELTKSDRDRRAYLPTGVIQTIEEHLAKELVERPRRQKAYLDQVQQRLEALEADGEGDSEKAEKARRLIDRIRRAQDDPRLLVNGKGLPFKNNLLRGLKQDICKAGIDPRGLCLHALRVTNNTAQRKAGVDVAKIQARIGHCSQAMTDLYTDFDCVDDGSETEAVAELLGIEDGNGKPAINGQSPSLLDGQREELRHLPLRPTADLLGQLAKNLSNVVIGRICEVSEATVRKWLKKYGITREGRQITGKLSDVEIAMMRSDLRRAISETDC